MEKIKIQDDTCVILNSSVRDYNILFDLPELRSIIINKKEINASDIEIISQQKNVEMLNFNFCNITSNNINFPIQLKHIIFAYTSLELSSINNLDNLRELEIVNDEEDRVEVDIKDILKFQNLSTLRIYNSRIKNAKEINKFKNLKEIFLDGSLVDTKDFSKELNRTIKLSYKSEYIFD